MPQLPPIDPKRLAIDRRFAARRRDGRFRHHRVRRGFALVAEEGAARRRSPRAGRPSNHTFGRTSSARPARRRDPPPCAGEAKSSLSAASRLGSPATTARSSSLDPLAAGMRRSRAARGARRVRAGHGVSRAPLNSLERNKVSLAACERSAIRQSTSPPRTEQERSLNGRAPPARDHPRPVPSTRKSPGPALPRYTHAMTPREWIKPQLCKARNPRALRGALGSRNQVRRLSHGGPHHTRQGPAPHPLRARLDRQISHNRRCPDKTSRPIRLSRRRTLRRASQRRLRLQPHAAGLRPRRRPCLFPFDLLELNGDPIAAMPLAERKSRLAALIGSPRPASTQPHEASDGEAFRRAACRHGLEGVVSKRLDRPYLPGDRTAWIKTKRLNRGEFVVAGWSDPEGSRSYLGSLLLAYHDDDGRLLYASRVGTGMSREDTRHVARASRAARGHNLPARHPAAARDALRQWPRAIARPLASTRSRRRDHLSHLG